MKKFKCIFAIFLVMLFIPKVYAFSYGFDINAGNLNVNKGTVRDLKVIIKDVSGVSGGFGACSMSINVSGGVSLNGSVRGLNNWSVTVGSLYSFDTADAFVSNTEMALVPIKIDDAGSISFTNIKCSDGETNEVIDDKVINFEIIKNEVNNNPPNNNDSSNNNSGSSNNKEEDGGSAPAVVDGNITKIILSEGSIDFSPTVYEYNVNIKDFTMFDVSLEVDDNVSSYDINKKDDNGKKSVVISILTSSGVTKRYVINVNEIQINDIDNPDNTLKEENEKGFNFVPIFIGIIGLLVLINILRILKKFKKKD